MYAGSDDAVKVWLNGKLVHDNPVDRGAKDYQDDFPVTLKKGKNTLLVAVYEAQYGWSGFFGFEVDTVYSLIPPAFLPNKGVIPDRILAARIRSRLGLGPNANLNKQKVRKLTQLTANDAGIKDLTGLEYATQLRSLSLVGNQIRDVSPLAGLKNLQVLSISENRIEGTGALFTLLKKNPNLELDITIPTAEHPPIYWLTRLVTDMNQNITRPAYIQRLTNVSANIETLWESSPTGPNAHQLAVDTVAGKLYWIEEIDGARSELKRANLDGSAPQKLKTLRSVLTSIAVDTKKRKLYWTNSDGRIQRANLNGKQIKTLVEHLDAPAHLTVDVDGGKLYWVEGFRVWRSDLNGKNIKRVITAASDTGEVIRVLSIAVANGKIYWIQWEADAVKYPNSPAPNKLGGRLLRANLNGSNVEELIVPESLIAFDLAVDPAGESLYYVGLGTSGASHIFRRSLNGNSEGEIAVYYESFGGPIQIVLGISPTSIAAAPAENPQTSAQSEIPDATRLLANYPNPFNPETWIPYQLAEPSDVKITIYDARGVVVRQLALGHQLAGTYTSRSRAAYWDGRNNQGERVASGIYFYQFQAGNISSLRKMLILK